LPAGYFLLHQFGFVKAKRQTQRDFLV